MKEENTVRKIVLGAMFLSIGIVLPFFTGQIPQIGRMLLPMHIPVFLCGLICGWKYGAVVGLVLPFLRSFIFGMPPLYPNAVWMAAELAAYGLVIGLLYRFIRVRGRVYIALISAQLAGRVVWGVVKAILLGASGKTFAFSAFLTGGFVDAFPGILLQIILIPPILLLLEKRLKFGEKA